MSLRFIILCFAAVFGFGLFNAHAFGPEYMLDESPAPASTDAISSPIKKGLEKKEKKPSQFPSLRKKLEHQNPFFRDTGLDLKIRSYTFGKDFDNPDEKQETWALGGWLEYESGWWKNRIKIGATGYTSQKLYGPEDKDGAMLLAPGQEGIAVVGQAYLIGRVVDDVKFRLFRQAFDLPFVNKNDSRMIPNTFEAYSLIGRSVGKADFILSQVTRMKNRNSSDFEYMSEVAGVPSSSKPLTMGGFYYSFSKAFSIGSIDQYGWDTWNTLYVDGKANWNLTKELGLRISAQYIDQKSVGEELAGKFSTHALGGQTAISYRNAVLTLAYTTTDNAGETQNPFGGHPSPISLMIKDFNRAGEDAWLVGLSYEFSRIGMDGLSAFARYAHGNTPDSGAVASPDQDELDLTVDYHFKEGLLKGLWLRLRVAYLDQAGPQARDVSNFRAILNYDIAIF
jgi:hypothetical protein